MRPTPLFLRLLWGWLALSLAAALWPSLVEAWAAAGFCLFSLFGLDIWFIRQQTPPPVEREIAHSQPVGLWRPVSLTISNTTSRPLRVTAFDHYPLQSDIQDLPLTMNIAPHTRAEMTYQIRFNNRGEQTFSGVDLLIDAPWKLAQRRMFIPNEFTVRVYPNFAAIAKYALLATDHHLSQIGIRHRRRRGQGLEFHQLREYREGDALRQIDWKTTSRLRKLISREYQDERDQQIMFLLDCGNRMRTKDGALSHFDEALNAMLLLAHVALKQGDAVGCMSFGHDSRFVPARKGRAALSVLMETLFDLEPGLNAPDYATAATRLAEATDKRSLVLILTNLRDEDSNELATAVKVLRKRHLVVVASLRETAVTQLAATPVTDFNSALTIAAARHYFNARHQTLEKLKLSGAQILDVEPAALPVALVNRYLDIKRRGVL
jgi:uncharacterized protein (DUF58 family)